MDGIKVFEGSNLLDPFVKNMQQNSWSTVIERSPFPFANLQSMLPIFQAKGCFQEEKEALVKPRKEQFFTSPEASTQRQSEDRILLIDVLLESLNMPTVEAQFTDKTPIMPFFMSLLHQSGYLTSSWHLLGGSYTSHSEFLVLCGKDVDEDINPFMNIHGFNGTCLPEYLGMQGFESATIHANGLGFYNRYKAYPRLGFHKMIAKPDMGKVAVEDLDRLGPSDSFVFRFGLKALEFPHLQKNYLLHIVTLQTHGPYETRRKPSDKEILQSSYLPEAHPEFVLDLKTHMNLARQLDADIKSFVDELVKQTTDESNTKVVLVLYGDHNPRISLLSNESKNIVKNGRVPYLALAFKMGEMEVLPFTETSTKSLGDTFDILARQLAGSRIAQGVEQSFAAWSSALRDPFKNELREIRGFKVDAMGNILNSYPEHVLANRGFEVKCIF